MKRVLINFFIVFLMFFTMTLNVDAYTTSISGASISGGDSAVTGGTFQESFHVNFSNLKKGSTDTLGIWLVAFELDFDESVFSVESIPNNGSTWDTMIYREDGEIYVISEFVDDHYGNSCVDGILYCADYLVNLQFYVKDTTATSSTIKMKQISAGGFPVSGDMNASYSTDDMVEIEYANEASKVISITKLTNTEIKVPENIISNSTPKVEAPVSTNNTNTSTNHEKSNNKYLASLSVENYNIDFSKDTKIYSIDISKDINKLNITAIPEDSKSTVEVKGADNLKDNDYKITIKVTAENGDKNTYYVYADIPEDVKATDLKKDEEKKKFTLDKKTIIFISIGGSLIIIGIIIFAIRNRINDKKIDKELDF